MNTRYTAAQYAECIPVTPSTRLGRVPADSVRPGMLVAVGRYIDGQQFTVALEVKSCRRGAKRVGWTLEDGTTTFLLPWEGVEVV